MNGNLVREGYNKVVERYSSQRDKFKGNKYLEEFTKLLKPDSKVLDIGCGSGIPIDKYLISKDFKIIGIDISRKQIDLARKNNPQASYEVKDMSDLQYGEYNVDAAISFYSIFHIPREQHRELFKKINSFLPVGGSILVTMGAAEWEGFEEDFHGTKMWWSHYGPKKNRKIIENVGFEVILDEIDEKEGEKHQIIIAKKL